MHKMRIFLADMRLSRPHLKPIILVLWSVRRIRRPTLGLQRLYMNRRPSRSRNGSVLRGEDQSLRLADPRGEATRLLIAAERVTVSAARRRTIMRKELAIPLVLG
jgi:hypothetical protein